MNHATSCMILHALLCVTPCWCLGLSPAAGAAEDPVRLLSDADARPRRPLVVLLWIINNRNAIAHNAGDPRYSTLSGVAEQLKDRGHTVLLEGQRLNRKNPKLSGLEWLTEDSIKQHGKPDLIVTWVNYLHDNGRHKFGAHPLLKQLMTGEERPIPQIIYENGMLKNTVTVDPQGQLADSYYVSSLNDLVQEDFDDKSCTDFVHGLLADDSSKRPQEVKEDIPMEKITGRYVFVPTQKFEDISVAKYSNVTYPELLKKVTAFCKANDLPLVIKIHPHLLGTAEEARQKRLIFKLKHQWREHVHLTKSSINDLMQNALFTVTVNGGTLMDNFVTNTPVLTLAPSLWYKTDAVVYDTDIDSGLNRMLKEASPWSEKRQARQRQNVCWYRRMSFSTEKTDAENLEVLQRHVDALRLPTPLAL